MVMTYGIGPEVEVYQPDATTNNNLIPADEPFDLTSGTAIVVKIKVSQGFSVDYCAFIDSAGNHTPGDIGTITNNYHTVSWQANATPGTGCNFLLHADGSDAAGDTDSCSWAAHFPSEEGACDTVDPGDYELDPIDLPNIPVPMEFEMDGPVAPTPARYVAYAGFKGLGAKKRKKTTPEILFPNPGAVSRQLIIKVRYKRRRPPMTIFAIPLNNDDSLDMDQRRLPEEVVRKNDRTRFYRYQLQNNRRYVFRFLFRRFRSFQTAKNATFNT
jgi:hypothetical protein